MRTRLFRLWYVSLIYIFLVMHHVGSVSFNFNFSDKNATEIRFEGDAHYNNLDRISLTGDADTNIHYSEGRASYNQSVPLWDMHTGEVTNFTSRFSFLVQNITPSGYGDGLAFFLSPYPSQLPVDGAESCLGLCSKSIYPSTKDQIIAVEFDTYLNPDIDPNSTDPTDCHIGIDVYSIKSNNYTLIRNSLFLGVRMTAQIEYNSRQKRLSVLLWHDADPNMNFSVHATVDIKELLPSVSAVGFSASTGGGVELHHIFSWSFNSTLENKNASNSPPLSALAIGLVVGGIIIVLSSVGILVYYLRRNGVIKSTGDIEVIGVQSIDYEFEKGRGPRRFPYNDLVDATNGFSENNKLGEGGFGSVYRGVLNDENIHVALKRMSKESKQGKKEYISEVKIIRQLRHRNLVQLIGWCHDHEEFLLVYELMHNGSLDRHLYGKEKSLTWPIRHNIALGLGSALLYLHEEWQQCVVHRDNIKPSNIMLDSSFNAKLGDFGLARLIDHNQDLETTIAAGTKGYMAPECVLGIANPSTQSDIFSFGVVLLEIACGRGPIVPQHDQKKVSLVEWVWYLYGQNALVEAVDDRLNDDFDRDEVECFMVVGLWCAHTEKYLRPSIKQAMSVLQFQAHLPILPPKMPVPIYATPVDPNMQLYTSSVATSSGIGATSTNSAPVVPSSDSSWLLKQGNTF